MMAKTGKRTSFPQGRESGVALVIVLAMMVLLLGILAAFLSRSGINRDTSASSASLTSVDLLTTLAVTNVLRNLQEEIRDPARSTEYASPNGGQTLYLPLEPEHAVPALDLPGLTVAGLPGSGMENLLKISRVNPAAPERSTGLPSLNGRQLTPARWNKPLLMQRTADDGSDNSPPAAFPMPDWILVSRDGLNPDTIDEARWDADTSNRSTVIGRYAFVIYNQGGLLDANVAGYPAAADVPITGTNIDQPARYKPSAAYADLTIPSIGLTQTQVDTWVREWRNQATFASTNPAAEYFRINLQNQSGFISISNTSAPGGVTDRMFTGRHQLITFFEDSLGGRNSELMDSLQYFTTFSRSLSRPTFYRMQGQDDSLPNWDEDAPEISLNWDTVRISNNNPPQLYWASMSDRGNSARGQDALINPIIPSITMTGSGTRIDGSSFEAGDPLLIKRFPLDRLLWVTYKGPSADLPVADPLRAALAAEGITSEDLSQGTVPNIEAAFGLRWTAGPGPGGLGGYWTYNVHSGSNPIDVLESVAGQNREPDFFEILKATVSAGAIGRAREGYKVDRNNTPAFLDQIRMDSFINNHILQLGANILDQVHPENYPTHIVLPRQAGNHRDTAQSFWGTVDLPYLHGTTYGSVLVENPATPILNPDSPNRQTPPVPGLVGVPVGEITPETGTFIKMQFPVLWNPHGRKANPPTSNLTPQNLRILVTTSSMALPSEIGDDVDPGQGDLERFASIVNLNDHGGRTPINPAYREFVRTNWHTNAGDADAETLGVMRFAANDRTALLFDLDPNDASLFRQPTPLIRPGLPAGINLRVTNGHQLANVPLGLLGTRDYSGGVPEVGSGIGYLGFYVGRFPVRFNTFIAGTEYTFTTRSTQAHHGIGSFTYSLEYSPDSGSSWVPYKQVPVPVRTTGAGRDNITAPWEGNPSTGIPNEIYRTSLVNRWQVVHQDERWPSADPVRFFFDPRTSRWGTDGKMPQPGFSPDPSSGIFHSLRPGAPLGGPLTGQDIRDGGAASKTSMLLHIAQLNQESTHWHTTLVGPSNYVPFYDADNVLRRPMGAWVPDTTSQNAGTTIGLPLADGGASATGSDANRFNRPIILHRPFRSVAELSYVFSDSPWRNIDFFTPESGFTGLLDVFTVSDDQRTGLVEAGKVDLNTRQRPVLAALLAGGYRDELDTAGMQGIPPARAEELADALINRTTSTAPGKGPLWNLAHLVGRFDGDVDIQASTPSALPVRFDGFSADLGGTVAPENIVQRLREAPIRILSQNGQAGTWNLLVDIVAQTGRYPASAQSFDNFLVEGELRAWLHLAIDRLTGKVLDYQIEVVTE